ncbi:MAG TPA: LysR family transcriptional regulator [Lacisediminihabitans sp.]|uniref:LysR family transcriptional regulator n=1 Tax=Lacisediminihabitans sp. TaxID=2787631 RepID=UPI002ED92628
MLDIRKLNMLAELDRLGTIAAVSKSLHLTAPGISMQLTALEREIGVQLTERQGRRIVVTPAGRLLARHGSAIVDMLTVAEMEATALRDGAIGTYRIAAFPSVARAVIPEAWHELATGEGPGIELRLIEMEPSDALPALSSGEVELAVAHRYSNMPPIAGVGLDLTQIRSEKVYLAISDSQLPTKDTAIARLADFAGHDWIVPGREWTCFDMVHRATDVAGFEPHTVAEATDYRVQLSLVAAGIGVALVPELAASEAAVNVRLLELANPIFRHMVLASRSASAADAGLNRIREAITRSAERALPHPSSAMG